MFHAEIEATNVCNTRCLHCPHETMTRPSGRMSWATFDTIIGNFRNHLRGERYSLSFSGMGEPLLNPELPRFIAYVAQEARTSFACNGSALTERNVHALIAAGLNSLYLSFNGDEARLYEKMMGGLNFHHVLANARRAVQLAHGTQLEIRANVSVTKQTQPRVTAIRELLREVGVQAITFSLAHSRGGNLGDRTVCDTPPSPPDLVHCAVVGHTLFVDWRGHVFICDHDLHGDHGLGDLTTEPLGDVLARRQKLIDGGMSYALCRQCNDLLKGGFRLFQNEVGGVLSDWVYALHSAAERDPLADAAPALRWVLQIYQREGRLDRAIGRLLGVERELQQRVAVEQASREAVREYLTQEVTNRDRRITELERELAQIYHGASWHWLERFRHFGQLVTNLAASRRPASAGRLGILLPPPDTARARQIV